MILEQFLSNFLEKPQPRELDLNNRLKLPLELDETAKSFRRYLRTKSRLQKKYDLDENKRKAKIARGNSGFFIIPPENSDEMEYCLFTLQHAVQIIDDVTDGKIRDLLVKAHELSTFAQPPFANENNPDGDPAASQAFHWLSNDIHVLQVPTPSKPKNNDRFFAQRLATYGHELMHVVTAYTNNMKNNHVDSISSISDFPTPVSILGALTEIVSFACEEAILNELQKKYPQNEQARRAVEIFNEKKQILLNLQGREDKQHAYANYQQNVWNSFLGNRPTTSKRYLSVMAHRVAFLFLDQMYEKGWTVKQLPDLLNVMQRACDNRVNEYDAIELVTDNGSPTKEWEMLRVALFEML